MFRSNPLVVGEIAIDFTMPSRFTRAKVRLGGVVHAARGLWAAEQDYSIGAFCPAFLVEQAKDYLLQHGCKEFILLGEVIGAPNVIAIADLKEVGYQGYEDLLRDERRIETSYGDADLSGFDPVIIFPGKYDLSDLISHFGRDVCITVDAAYGVKAPDLHSLSGRVDNLVLSTSSDLFFDLGAQDVRPLIKAAKGAGAKRLLLKENRGGSRLFDLESDQTAYVTATLDVTVNPVGVGDAYTAVFATRDCDPVDAAWRGMQVATIYSQTTWPDDLRRDVGRELKLDIELVRTLGGVSLPWHMRPNLPIYLAAPDFSYANYEEISSAVAALEYHNFRVRRPVKENGEAMQGSSVNSLLPFFKKDVQLLRECAAVFAIPINRDPGTLVEVGLAIAMGKPVVAFDPRNENNNTMLVVGSACYSSDLGVCVNAAFEALSSINRNT